MEKKSGHNRKNIIITVITVVLFVLAILTITVSMISASNGTPVNIFGYTLSYVPTESMEPTIKKDSYIIIKKASANTMAEGDIIVYKSLEGETKGMLIVHRIYSVTTEGFVMKGDNNYIVDPEVVTSDMVYGKFVSNADLLNKLSFNINRTFIFVIVIIMLLAFTIIQFVNVLIVFKQKETEKQKEELKNILLEKMKNEIYQEELEKLKNKEKKDS